MSQDTHTPDDEQPSGGVSFGMTDMTVFRDRSLPPNVKLVYVALVGYADRDRRCWPSRERIAHDTGLSVRAVARALKMMTEAGLITLVRTQASNRYTIHDRGGSYLHGSGPGGLTVLLERTHSPAGRDSQSPELDQRPRPATQTTTSSDAASGAHHASAMGERGTPIKIYPKRGFYRIAEHGDAVQSLVACAVTAMEAAGLVIHDNAANAIGHTLAESYETATRQQMVEIVERWVNRAGDPTDEGAGWLASWPGRKAS